MTQVIGSYRVQTLPNGFIRVDDRASGLTGLFNRDGSVRSGDLRRIPVRVHDAILKAGV